MLDGADRGVEEGLDNDLTRTLTAVTTPTELPKIEMGQWRVVLDDLPHKSAQIHSSFS